MNLIMLNHFSDKNINKLKIFTNTIPAKTQSVISGVFKMLHSMNLLMKLKLLIKKLLMLMSISNGLPQSVVQKKAIQEIQSNVFIFLFYYFLKSK